jgi:hypothetical protein
MVFTAGPSHVIRMSRSFVLSVGVVTRRRPKYTCGEKKHMASIFKPAVPDRL